MPAVRKTQVQSLGQEDPLEKGMATHYSILAWRIPWTEEPGGLQSTGSRRVGHDLDAQSGNIGCVGQKDVLEETEAEQSDTEGFLSCLGMCIVKLGSALQNRP